MVLPSQVSKISKDGDSMGSVGNLFIQIDCLHQIVSQFRTDPVSDLGFQSLYKMITTFRWIYPEGMSKLSGQTEIHLPPCSLYLLIPCTKHCGRKLCELQNINVREKQNDADNCLWSHTPTRQIQYFI